MSNNILPDSEHQKKYAEAIKIARLKGLESFHNWFDKSGSLEELTLRGFWDFSFHILTPAVQKLMANPERKTALEIGYGGGRVLNAACHFFSKVIGIDIHDEGATVSKYLRMKGKNNFELIKSDGMSIEVPSESIDFIYSFIVFQHLPSFDVFQCYLQEILRALAPMGVAQLYFGKYSRLHPIDQIRFFSRGYKEIKDAPVNHTSLVIRVRKVKRICKEIGFKVIGTGTSYKNIPDGYSKIKGGQNFITLLKPY
jgi:SAM-dependent methyltransferase